MIRALLCSLLLWPLYLAAFIPLSLVGLVILWPLCLLHCWVGRPSYVEQFRTTGQGYHWGLGWLTWLWDNEEDGVRGPTWWRLRTKANHGYVEAAWSAYRWSALRNPVNNLRFIPWVNPKIVPDRIRYRQGYLLGAGWWFTWQGPYTGLLWFPKYRGTTYRFWLGWKLKWEDRNGVDPTDMRATRCGFAIQLKRMPW